ncbi:MAG: TonB-dependent receptor plug domain-containing protein [Verrucomicrobia bacterium]|nr:TonB-dependent receptor plug domain-containing protein [Verrucomicrobiota bacterium]
MTSRLRPRVILATASALCANLAALAQGAAGSSPEKTSDQAPVVLSPFQVSEDNDHGYRKLTTVTSSRVGIPILNQPLAIEVVSGELLRDFSVTDDLTVFRYSASATVIENDVGQANTVTMRGFDMPRYFNGVRYSSALGITPYLVLDNIDRVEIAKGAQGLFYGNSTPNGVANYITKKPQFVTATSLQLTGGNFAYSKALLDAQGVIRKDELAWRLISSYYERDGRVEGQHRSMTFLAPSVVYRPYSKLQVDAELNYTRQKIPYPTMARDFGINPQYYQDLTNPSQAILDYMKTKYSLADDAAARAKVQERWGRTQVWNTFILNWVADTLDRTHQQPFWDTGSTINFARYSPLGDKMQETLGDQDGETKVYDAGVTFTPIDNLSLKYHWTRMEGSADFVRQFYLPNGGLRADGRAPTVNVQYADLSTDGVRAAYSDVQTLDAVYELELAKIKHQILMGAEWRRSVQWNGNTTIDYSKATPSVDELGNPLTGVAVYQYYDPFAGKPIPDIGILRNGPAKRNSVSNSDFRDLYTTYRASALEGKLDFMAGVRQVRQKQTGFNHNTWTLGAVYEVIPGFRAFASIGQNFVFSNRYSIEGPGVTAQELATRKFLDFEKGKGIEIGVKSNWRDNTISGSISHYFDQRDGIIRNSYNKNSVEARNFDTNPNNNVTWAENGGRVQVKGIDGDIAWTPNRNFQGIVNFNYEYEAKTVSDPTIDMNSPFLTIYTKTFLRRPQKNPVWKTNFIAKYNFTDGPLKNCSIGGAVRYSGAYNLTDAFYSDQIVPAETIIDLFATYRTKLGATPTEFTLNLGNVTDKVNDLTRGDGFEARLSVTFKL